MPTAAQALSCADQITQRAAACITAEGLANAVSCRARAEAQGCGFGAAEADPPCARRARIDLDWVFDDDGAHGTFDRARRSGASAFEAALTAQAHNPSVQANLRSCRAWVEAYLDRRDPQPATDPPALSADSCRCISVVPASGLVYSVTNSCQALQVSVLFKDAMNTTRSSWARAGTVGAAGATVEAPNYELVSIAGIRLGDGRTSLTCSY